MRWLFPGVFAIVALLSGIWSGEDIKGLFISDAGLIAAAVLLVLAGLASRGILPRILSCIGAIVLFSAGHFIGRIESRNAYGKCVSDGESVRVALEAFRSRTGHYPDRLKDLEIALPGDRFLRGTILDYHRTETGYQITFSDWLVSHRATEQQPFTAHK